MTVQIAVRLDDALAAQVKAAADDAGTNLSEWVRAALQHQALLAKSMQARRAEEDARQAPYTEEQEAALMTARRRRAIAALDER